MSLLLMIILLIFGVIELVTALMYSNTTCAVLALIAFLLAAFSDEIWEMTHVHKG